MTASPSVAHSLAFSASTWCAISTRERPPPRIARKSAPSTHRPAPALPTGAGPRRVRLAPLHPQISPITPQQFNDSPLSSPVRTIAPTHTPKQPADSLPLSNPSSSPSSSNKSSVSSRASRRTRKPQSARSVSAPPRHAVPPVAPPGQVDWTEVNSDRLTEELSVDSFLQSPMSAADEPTEGEKAFLNEQLEKRKRQKETQAATAATKSKPRGKNNRVQKRKPRTSRSSSTGLKDNFQVYMDEISREELLGQAEVITLATVIREGVTVEDTQATMRSTLGRRPSLSELATELGLDAKEVQRRRMAGTAAKNTLVAANLRLVTSVARKVSKSMNGAGSSLAFDDMMQEGSVGLIRAAEKFDASRGYKFSTYATWWIRASVMRSITTQSRAIKVPSTVVDEYSRIRREFQRLREGGIFAPTDGQVAKALGTTPAKLRFVVNAVTQTPGSLDINLDIKGDGGSTRALAELIEGDDRVEERMVIEMERNELDKALRESLKPMERAVIRLRFGLDDGQPRTLRETGNLLGLSKERIRQVIFRALPKLRTPEIQEMLTAATTH